MISPDQKARILWRCRRGMLELDVLLARFVEQRLEALSEDQLLCFEDFLNQPDPDLYAWLMGYDQPTDEQHAQCLALIRNSVAI